MDTTLGAACAVTGRPAGESVRSLRAAVGCLAVGVAATLLLLTEQTYLYTVVGLLALCVAVPMWLDGMRGRLDWFEVLHVYGLVYFTFFGLGAVWTVHDPKFVAYDRHIVPYIPRSALYCLLGYAAMLCGYFAVRRHARPASAVAAEWPRGALFLRLTGLAGLIGFLSQAMVERLAQAHRAAPLIQSALSQLSPLFLFSWALAWMLFYSGRASRSQVRDLFVFSIPAALLVVWWTVSDKSLLMTLAGVPIVARWYYRRRIPWAALVLLLIVLMFVVFPLYNAFRSADTSMDTSWRLGTTIQNIRGWDSERYRKFSVDMFKRRMAMINSVAVVVRDTGRWVPYANGSTLFLPALQFAIPRVIWRNKPTTTQGQEFGRLFHVTNYLSRDAHIGASVPGELYWNFGVPGIVIGSGAIGAMLGLAYRRYGAGSGVGPVQRAIYVLLLVEFVHLGGSLSLAIVNIGRTLLVLEALRWFSRRAGLLGPPAEDLAGSKETAPA